MNVCFMRVFWCVLFCGSTCGCRAYMTCNDIVGDNREFGRIEEKSFRKNDESDCR